MLEEERYERRASRRPDGHLSASIHQEISALDCAFKKKGGKGEPTFCKIFKHMILRCCVKKTNWQLSLFFGTGMKQTGIPHLWQHPSPFWKSSKEGSVSLSYFPLTCHWSGGQLHTDGQPGEQEQRISEKLNSAAQHRHFIKGWELILICRVVAIRIPSLRNR